MKQRRLLLSIAALGALALIACSDETTAPSPEVADIASSAQTAGVTLAYTRDNATVLSHVLAEAVGQEVEVPLPDGCSQVAELALAPGSASLAVACASEPWALYVLDVARRDYVKVTEQRGGGPRWSPDGLTLAYGVSTVIEERAPSAPTAIRLVSSDGANDRELVPARLWQGVGPWAPDGKSILVTTCVPIDQLRGHLLITERHWLEGEREPDIVAEGVRPLDWSLRANAVLGSHDFCPEGSERPTPWAVEVPFGNSYAIAPPNMIPAGWLDSGEQALLYWMRSPETVAGEVWLADRKGSWQFERALAVPEGIDGLELAPDRRSVLYVDGTGGLYVWDVIERGEPRLLARDAPANLSAALDDTAD